MAHQPNPADYEAQKSAIETLKNQSQTGDIAVYFEDESGFSLTPSVSYAWQYKGQHLDVPTARSQRINVLGFLKWGGQELKSLVFNGSINTACVVAAIDHCFPSVEKETWIILDNAPMHKSHEFMEKTKAWAKRKIHILFLPSYSPELNPIEIIWRFMKYTWLPLSAYQSIKQLTESLNDILANYGKKYLITFA